MSESRVYPSIPNKMLVPIDFSPSSQAALEMAADLAHHFHAELYLVNVIQFLPITSFPDFAPEESFIATETARAKAHMATCCALLQAKGIKAASSVEVGIEVAGNIVEVVEREQVDMVVISTHGISGWHPLVFGSIAEKVLKLVACPILLIRSAKPESSITSSSDRASEWW